MTATITSPSAPARRGGAAAPRRRSSLWSETAVHVRRNLEHIRQIPEKLLDVTVQPLMFVLLFAYVFGGAIAVQGGNYREYMIGGILVQTLAFGLTGPATSLNADITDGVIDRFRTLPSRRSAYLLGHYVAELAGLVLAIVILLGAGVVVGWRFRGDALDAVVVTALLLAFASAMVWVGSLLGLLVRSADAVMGIGFTVVFPLTFLSSAFVPIGSLPGPLQVVASWNPVSTVVAAVRTLFGNPVAPVTRHTWPLDHPVPAAFAACALILAVTVPATLHRFARRTGD